MSVTAGQGHHQTAMAISDYFKSKNVESRVVDVLKYFAPAISEVVSKSYLMSTKHIPLAYGRAYAMAENKDPNREKVMSHITSTIIGKKLERLVIQYMPDAIICTHVFAAQILTRIKAFKGLSIGIITDFTIHPYWEDTNMDYYVTASELLTLQANKKGIPTERLLPIGIPIQEKFTKRLTKQQAREKLGIEDKKTVLIMSGSMGYGNLYSHVRKMDELDFDFQIMSVCGRNKQAKKLIDKINTKRNIYNFGYVDNIDVMMDAADVLVTKPGGLTVSEALAKSVPMILLKPIPGQEERNTEFLLNNGVAMKITKTTPIDVCLYQMLMNNWRYGLSQEIVKYVAKPHAAKDLGDFVINHVKNRIA
jgi:processive 1,2-diacylglycerol beta-glucosyltransferase